MAIEDIGKNALQVLEKVAQENAAADLGVVYG